jgi:hypothetical protein
MQHYCRILIKDKVQKTISSPGWFPVLWLVLDDPLSSSDRPVSETFSEKELSCSTKVEKLNSNQACWNTERSHRFLFEPTRGSQYPIEPDSLSDSGVELLLFSEVFYGFWDPLPPCLQLYRIFSIEELFTGEKLQNTLKINSTTKFRRNQQRNS